MTNRNSKKIREFSLKKPAGIIRIRQFLRSKISICIRAIERVVLTVRASLSAEGAPMRIFIKRYFYTAFPDDNRELYKNLITKFPDVNDSFFPHPMFDTNNRPDLNSLGTYYKFLFYKTFIGTIKGNDAFFKDNGVKPMDILWSEKNIPYANLSDQLIVEHGWLPRSSYQISSNGANSRGAVAGTGQVGFIDKLGGQEKLQQKISSLRTSFLHRPLSSRLDLPPEYIVAPFQTGDDLNLKFSGTIFEQYYNIPDSTRKFGQAFINYVEENILPFPVLFTQHPADHSHPNYQISKKANRFISHQSGLRTIDLIAAQNRCKGIITVNSNVIHEGLCLEIPCCCLGRLLWSDADSAPLPTTIAELIDALETNVLDNNRALEYLAKLLSFQWYLSDFQNPMIVLKILQHGDAVIPLDIRKQFGFS